MKGVGRSQIDATMPCRSRAPGTDEEDLLNRSWWCDACQSFADSIFPI